MFKMLDRDLMPGKMWVPRLHQMRTTVLAKTRTLSLWYTEDICWRYEEHQQISFLALALFKLLLSKLKE